MEKPLYWFASSKKDIQTMPDDVQDAFGYALHLVQHGEMPDNAKPFKITGESGVFEIVEDFDSDTYRAVYVVKLANAVYVLDCFQKKSKRGIATPKQDIERIRERLKRLKCMLNIAS